VNHGGTLETYKPRDCQLQSSARFADCNGEDNNLDLYIKTTPIGYEFRHQACVLKSNIQLYKDKSIDECAMLCNDDAECLAFEYGVNHGGGGWRYKPGDCQTQSSADFTRCNGQANNLDLYIKASTTPEVSLSDRSQYSLLAVVPGGYQYRPQACVLSSNIQLHGDKSIQECAKLCNDDAECSAFEYGVNHGGSDKKYKPRDCQLQSSSRFGGCDGKDLNLDLYIKTTPLGYVFRYQACVLKNNIQLYKDKSVDECAMLCNDDAECRAFEYGVDHGGSGWRYKPGDCQTQSSADFTRCDGKENNLDLYIKEDTLEC